MSREEVPRVLYIAGYGRSGSTILDILLGSHDRVVSVGEVAYLGDEWLEENRRCACGAPYERCTFWKEMISSAREAKRLSRIQRVIEHRRSIPQLLTGALSEESKRAYRNQMRGLLARIALKGDADVIVDSSKSPRLTTGRFWALKELAGVDLQVLHLVRDGRDVLSSFARKGSNWALEGYHEGKLLEVERALIGWVIANSVAYMLGRSLGRDRYIQVHFENLLAFPQNVLQRIGKFADLNMNSVAERVSQSRSFQVGHNVGGNRIRHKNKIQLRRKSLQDRCPGKGLSVYQKNLFRFSGNWMNWFFGYS